MLPYLTVFNLQIPSYTLLVLLGYAAGFVVAWNRKHAFGLDGSEAAAAYILAGVGALLGGKLLFMLQGLPDFLDGPGHDFLSYFMNAGLVFYGGMCGCLLSILLYARMLRIRVWDLMACLLPALPLAQCFGRIGCFLAGCCYGTPSDWGFIMNVSPIPPHDVRLFPVQLVEAGAVLVLYFVLVRMRTGSPADGRLLAAYLTGYGAIRFVLEFFRYDAVRGFAGGLSVSQWFSIGALAAGALLWLRCVSPAQTDGAPSDHGRLLKY